MHGRDTHIEDTGAGRRRDIRRRALTAPLALAVFVLAASAAQATGTLYVSNYGAGTVSAYSIATDGSLGAVAGSPFKAAVPLGAAVTPDGRYLYVSDFTWSGGVSAFAIAPSGGLSPVAGSPFPAKPGTWGVAITPDGRHLYTANGGANNVSAYSIEANGSLTAVPGSPFPAGSGPTSLAITPNGRYLYTTDEESNDLSAYSIAEDGALSPVGDSPYPAGKWPRAVSLAPDGKYLYVANHESKEITAFSIAADGTLAPVPGSPFPSVWDQLGVAVAPNGRYLYTASSGAGTPVSAFSITAEGALTPVPGSPFRPRGDDPDGVAVTPDSGYVYVTNTGVFEWEPGEPTNSTVTALSVAAGGGLSAIPGSPFATGYSPGEPVVSPDEGPTAAFTPAAAPAGDPTTFDATESSAPDYPPAGYRWEFGDGEAETTASATTAHTYATPGTYTATLTVTDTAGCSTEQIFTGQTVSCDGSSKAEISHPVTVPAGVRLGVASAGSGSGSVSGSPSGIACPGTCSYAYEPGTRVTLSASAASGSRFLGWEGAGCSGTGACEVTVGSATTVTATFEKLPVLRVSLTGSGAGLLASSPSGIACPGTCSYGYPPGTQITLTPIAASGSRFAGWEGAGCSGTGTCQVTVGSATAVTAAFATLPATPLEPPPPTPSFTAPTPPLPAPTPPPSIQDARQSATRWREGNPPARHVGHAKTPTGTTFSFSLDEQATVSLSFLQLMEGRRSGHGCLAATHENTRRKSCSYAVTRGMLSLAGHSGTNTVAFAGRISRANELRPGRYELVITASNTTGHNSAPVSLSFTIAK
jgi:6-phosphogluconolactonase (cycloisomerase 2 family)